MADYAGMSLRKELETRFADAERRRQEEDFLSRGWQPPAGWQRVGQSLKHDLEDVGYGMKKALSGATLGASDWALRKLGVTDEDYLAEREAEGLGNAVKGAGFVSELGGNMLGAGGALAKSLGKAGLKGLKLASTAGGLEGAAYGLTGSDSWSEVPQNVAKGAGFGAAMPVGLHGAGYGAKWLARPLTDKVTQYIGKQKLAKQLAKGAGFEDVNLGNVDDDLATRLNQVRNAENVSPVGNARTSVTGERIGHIRDGRILRDGRSPDFMADVVDTALFSKQPRVIRGNIPENQVIFDSSNPANKVVVSKNGNTDGISVITAMKDKSLGKINKRLGGLPFPPYGANITSDVSTAAGSFKIPDFQPLNISNIASNAETVNPAFQRSFVEALADEGKRRTMRNAVLSGAEDLSERARILSDRMAARKNGMYDQAFEDIIIIPELKKAKDAYKTFMDKAGEKLLPEDAVSKFYAENPVAQGVIENAREINPSAFKGIKQGSLAEFDELKRLLNAESKNVMSGTSASVKDAYKRAGNELKTLMDRNAGGFRDVNTRMAAAQTAQDIFESKLGKGLTQVGGSTATTSPFWSGITSPLAAAGVVGGAFNPVSLALTAGGLSAKALMRAARRNAGRRIADGIIRTPIEVNINPNLSAGLSAEAVKNYNNW